MWPFILISGLTIVGVFCFSVFVHELFHFLAAIVLKLGVSQVMIWPWPKNYILRVGGVIFTCSDMWGCAVITGFGIWWRSALVSVAGPLGNLVLAIVAGLILKQAINLNVTIVFLWLFVVNLAIFASAMIPISDFDGGCALDCLRNRY